MASSSFRSTVLRTTTGATADGAYRREASTPQRGCRIVSTMKDELIETIEAIRPDLQADGGDISFVGVDEDTGVVEVELVGACVSCPASTMTLKAGIERILKDRVDGVTEVKAVGMADESELFDIRH